MIKKVIVSGARGFLGRSIAQALETQGFEVVRVSRTPGTGYVDVKSYTQCPDGDFLIHLAEESNRGKVHQFGDEYSKKCIETNRQLCNRFGSNMLYGSSIAVYRKHECAEYKFKETDPVQISDVYSKIKIVNEEAVMKNGGVVFRFSNIFGLSSKKSNVISDILAQLNKNQPIMLQSTQPIRDFLHISEVPKAVCNTININFKGVLNIGSGEALSIEELAKEILKHSNSPDVNIVSLSSSTKHDFLIPDISKALTCINWAPEISVRKHLENLVSEYYV